MHAEGSAPTAAWPKAPAPGALGVRQTRGRRAAQLPRAAVKATIPICSLLDLHHQGPFALPLFLASQACWPRPGASSYLSPCRGGGASWSASPAQRAGRRRQRGAVGRTAAGPPPQGRALEAAAGAEHSTFKPLGPFSPRAFPDLTVPAVPDFSSRFVRRAKPLAALPAGLRHLHDRRLLHGDIGLKEGVRRRGAYWPMACERCAWVRPRRQWP